MKLKYFIRNSACPLLPFTRFSSERILAICNHLLYIHYYRIWLTILGARGCHFKEVCAYIIIPLL